MAVRTDTDNTNKNPELSGPMPDPSLLQGAPNPEYKIPSADKALFTCGTEPGSLQLALFAKDRLDDVTSAALGHTESGEPTEKTKNLKLVQRAILSRLFNKKFKPVEILNNAIDTAKETLQYDIESRDEEIRCLGENHPDIAAYKRLRDEAQARQKDIENYEPPSSGNITIADLEQMPKEIRTQFLNEIFEPAYNAYKDSYKQDRLAKEAGQGKTLSFGNFDEADIQRGLDWRKRVEKIASTPYERLTDTQRNFLQQNGMDAKTHNQFGLFQNPKLLQDYMDKFYPDKESTLQPGMARTKQTNGTAIKIKPDFEKTIQAALNQTDSKPSLSVQPQQALTQ